MAGDGEPLVTRTGRVLSDEDVQALVTEAERGYEVLGADATACCLWHHKVAAWIPAPGWWIHEHKFRNSGGFADPRSCPGMWNLPAPVVLAPRPDPEENPT
jgi:hypothetical protein